MYTAGDSIEFLRRIFGQVDIYNSGNVQVRCPNPHCASRKRKLAINVEKGFIFKCWVCEDKGSFFKLLKAYYPEHLREFIERFCDEKAIRNSTEKKDREPIVLPNDFRLLANRQDSKNPEIKRAINYLYKRGLVEKDLWYWKFGISNFGRFDNRVIMPSFSIKGELNYYAARALMPGEYIKYLLPQQPKKEIVFNEINIDFSQELTIVEGPMDAVKANQNCAVLNGSDLPEDSLLFIRIIQAKVPILLALDRDMQYSKVPKLVRLLQSYGIQTRVLPLGGHHDVGEMTKEEFRKLRREAQIWDRGSILRQRIEGLRG